MAVVIRRLEESDQTAVFDCGDAPLNNYLNKYAWVNQEKSSIGVTYVAVEEAVPRRVLGYFTIAISSVPREAFPKKHVRGLPNYDLQLILLGRLAVDLRFAGKGIGHALISEAFRINLRVSGEVGCRCIVTDAYRDRVSWYARYGSSQSREPRPNARRECSSISEPFGRHYSLSSSHPIRPPNLPSPSTISTNICSPHSPAHAIPVTRNRPMSSPATAPTHRAAGILEYRKHKGIEWDPAEDGFVLSKEQIERTPAA